MAMAIRILFVGRPSQTAERLKVTSSEEQSPFFNGDAASQFRLEFRMVTNQKAALAQIRTHPPHIILVELDAKPNSRVRFCEMVRYRLPTAAIIAIGKHTPQNPSLFDAYLPVPLDEAEVKRVIYRICVEAEGYQLKLGDVMLNIATRTVSTPNGHYRMTPKQCMLLQMLMQHNGKVVERREIMRSIWNTSFMDDTRTLDVHVRWLRERIEENPSKPQFLTTVRGVGYRLDL